MENKGIVKPLDNLSRIIIPKEMRDYLEIDENTPLEMTLYDDRIEFTKIQYSCIFCDSRKSLLEFNDKLICKKCLRRINKENKANTESSNKSERG